MRFGCSKGNDTLCNAAGMVVVKAAVDRETSAEHVLLVRAKDGGGLSCNVTVHITLTDINDNTPIFIHPRLEVTVLENSPVNTLVTRVQALDADAGNSKSFAYVNNNLGMHYT